MNFSHILRVLPNCESTSVKKQWCIEWFSTRIILTAKKHLPLTTLGIFVIISVSTVIPLSSLVPAVAPPSNKILAHSALLLSAASCKENTEAVACIKWHIFSDSFFFLSYALIFSLPKLTELNKGFEKLNRRMLWSRIWSLASFSFLINNCIGFHGWWLA